MKLRSLSAALVAVLVGATALIGVDVAKAPKATAVPAETGLAVLANQDASNSCTVNPTSTRDQHVLIAQPFSGTVQQDLLKPATVSGMLNEAKPYDHNNKVVALWGRQDSTRKGGVGVYDLKLGAWTTAFSLPDDFGSGDGLAHSVAALPGDGFAVAQTGTIAGSGWGFVVIFDSNGTKRQQVALKGVHGVEWDGSRDALFAVGDDYVARYSYDSTAKTISLRDSWAIPTGVDGKKGGHDLRRRRSDNNYFVTTNDAVWIFNPEARTFTEVRKGTAAIKGVKTIDERYDRAVEYGWATPATFFFLNSTTTQTNAQFCMQAYKVRWLYNRDTAGYPEEDATAPPPPDPVTEPADAEPFLWERNLVRPSGFTSVSGQVWVGGASGDLQPSDSAAKVTAAYGSSALPYIKFYHWGDDGHPKMSDINSNTTMTDLSSWPKYATAISNAIGKTREAWVTIEPEWDSNPGALCNTAYRKTLKDVIGIFRLNSPKATLLNGIGLWKRDSDYDCFRSSNTTTYPDTANLPKLFDIHGFPLHIVSSDPYCTLRDPSHERYSFEPYFTGGYATVEQAKDVIRKLGSGKISRIKSLFSVDTVFITDLAVTRCGWGDSGQAQIFQELIDHITDASTVGDTKLYANYGLRGVTIRSGGPSKNQRYLGVENEGQFDYANKPGGTTISNGKDTIRTYLTSISGTQTDPPAFDSSVAGPANVAPGSSATFTVTVTNTKGSYSNANVDFEVQNSANTKVKQCSWPGQNFANGQSHTYSCTWDVPATTPAGAYKLKIGVFDANWTSPPVDWNDTAGTINVGTNDPSFTTSASASPSTVTPGGTTVITSVVTNSGNTLTNGVVEVEVRSPSGQLISQQVYEGQTITTGTSATYTWSFTAPATAGTYSIGINVYGQGRTPLYSTNGSAGSFTVATSKFTSSASVSPSTAAPGAAVTITATVTNTGSDALVNGVIDLELYDASDVQVTGGQQSWSGQTIAVGASATYTWSITAPTTPGTYRVKVGVFGTNWTPTLHWNDKAGTLVVATPTFDLTATAAPASVQPGGPVTIGVSATNNGGQVSNVIVDAEVYDSAGVRVANGQKSWPGETLSSGVTKNYTWSFTAPSTLGTYTVKLGIFTAGWASTLKWNNNADQLVVANPTFTSGAQVSSSTVSPGGTVTITATFTNTGASMSNGITDLEIYNSSGTRVAQQSWSAQAIDTGRSGTFSYAWPASSTPGTYTVKLGVFSPGWAATWHWNGSAATISVGSSFQPSFRVGDGANTWWIEVYTSNDVTGVDAIGGDGRFYLSLTKKSWGAWAGTAPSELNAGDLIRFIARRSSDGSTAGSNNFFWLQASPTTDPGWACTFTIGSGASTSWVEVATSAATSVEVKVGTGAFTALTYSSASGKWGKAMSVAAGSKVVFRATRSDGARAYSTIYNWLQ